MVHTERKKESGYWRTFFFFERTALDECVSINIAENTRLRPWEAIGRETEKKRKEKKKKQLYSTGWIGTSTRDTTHIHPSA